MLIGLTGQIGAGKSTAAGILADMGAHIVDADLIGKEVVDKSAQLRAKLARRFGPEIFDKRGFLKRSRLAQLAFATEESKQALNDLVHPYLLKELRRQAKAALKKHDLVVVDAALLLYWQMDREVDFVLVIHASKQSRFARMAKRGITETDALARQQAQLPYSEFQKRADRVILNNRTLQLLKKRLVKFLRDIHPESR